MSFAYISSISIQKMIKMCLALVRQDNGQTQLVGINLKYLHPPNNEYIDDGL